MGMTIDECIEIWTHPTQYFSSKREEAVDFAINTLRKYQKIEQAYFAYLETMNPDTLADLISTII